MLQAEQGNAVTGYQRQRRSADHKLPIWFKILNVTDPILLGCQNLITYAGRVCYGGLFSCSARAMSFDRTPCNMMTALDMRPALGTMPAHSPNTP